MSRKVIFWIITLCLPLVLLLALVSGYYAYQKLTLAAEFCGPFAQVDGEIGWVLRPDAESCYGMRRPDDPTQWAFQSRVFTNGDGFRVPEPGIETPSGGIMAIGDSWTFGYGLDYAESYPAWLSRVAHRPVVNVSSPAYSAVQAILLAERWVDALDPQALVFLDLGFWDRGACRGRTKPRAILKPCYWFDPDSGETLRVVPQPGLVERASGLGILPGGMLGAGEDGWNYFVISRPVLRTLGLLTQLGLTSGMAHDFKAVGVDPQHIRAGVFRDLVALAARAQAPLILLDPYDAYEDFHDPVAHSGRPQIVRVGHEEWEPNVTMPASALPPDQQRVPIDRHFGPGMNRLIAENVARILERLAGR